MKFSLRKTYGEPFVWLTATGLALGLIMVVGLVGLIMVKGMESFWPKRVLEIVLKNSEQPLLGQIVLKRDQSGFKDKKEWQIFLGNRDRLGEGFRFIQEDKISRLSQPLDIVVIERREYGPALGRFLKLELAQNRVLKVGDQDFYKTLNQELDIVSNQWDEIRDLEKNQVGDINAKIQKLIEKKKGLERKEYSSISKKIKVIDDKIHKLNETYNALAATASNLRQLSSQNKLVYQIFNGEEVGLALGQIISYYRPNQMGLFSRTFKFCTHLFNFLLTEPREANTEGGIFPALFGTMIMTILMSAMVTPFGVIAAIYLREYAKQGFFVRLVRISVNNLAGVPSVIFGVFGLGFFVYFLGGSLDQLFFSNRFPTPTFGTGGLLWASLTLALLTLPVVIVASEEALAAVPRGAREAALACGASKWQMIQRIVLPAALPGVLTGLILAMARGAGEVAPLMLVGVVKLAPTLPLNMTYPFIHLDQKFMHLGFHIYDLGFQSPDSDAAKPMIYATALLMIILVLALNLGAIAIREHLRRKYGSGAF